MNSGKLEARVARLENAIKQVRSARKFESANMTDLLSALSDNLGELYNVDVAARGNRLIADIDDGDESGWSIGGTFEVVPTRTYYEVNVLDGAGNLEYELGTASDMEEAAELIAEEVNQWVMDL